MPRQKRRAARTPSTTQHSVDTSALVAFDGIDRQPEPTTSWDDICRDLCEQLGLPDLNSRNGIKRVHAEFDRVQKKLNDSYDQCNSSDEIQGGIVMIWAKLSMDGFLRIRILAAGVISKICPLLGRSQTRMIALQALSTITSYGDNASRREIASDCVPPLLNLMDEFPFDVMLNQQVIIILAHVVESVVIDDETPPSIVAMVIRALNLPRILRLILANFFTVACSRCPREVKATPSVIDILVASLRSTDLSTRANALAGIILLTGEDCEDDSSRIDMSRLMDFQQLPPHLKRMIVQGSSAPEGDTLQSIRCVEEYRDAMMQCAHDRNLYTLGMRISRVFVGTDVGLVGGWPVTDPQTGREEYIDVGLPFRLWQDSPPHCIKALRERGAPEDLNAADIIQLKTMFEKSKITEAVQFALEAIERNPHTAFFYYAVGVGPDPVIGLRYLKKGMKCESTLTPFLRRAMARLAVSHATALALGILGKHNTDRSDYALGVAFLTSAHEDVKSFVENAALDSRSMFEMLQWCILLEMAIRGPEISIDLKELEPVIAKIQPAIEFLEFLRYPVRNSLVRLAKDLVVDRYASAWCDWGDTITHMDNQHSTTGSDLHHHSVEHADANLAAWLEGVEIADEPVLNRPTRIHPIVNSSSLALYKCSHCQNPSAILRKCSGCGQTRYCDAYCQRAHWQRHKAACKATQAQG